MSCDIIIKLYKSIVIDFFIGENDPEKRDNLVFSPHPISVSTTSEFMTCNKCDVNLKMSFSLFSSEFS